eukprot:scaffold455_cov155-Ochromonas_danica.AAC.10
MSSYGEDLVEGDGEVETRDLLLEVVEGDGEGAGAIDYEVSVRADQGGDGGALFLCFVLIEVVEVEAALEVSRHGVQAIPMARVGVDEVDELVAVRLLEDTRAGDHSLAADRGGDEEDVIGLVGQQRLEEERNVVCPYDGILHRRHAHQAVLLSARPDNPSNGGQIARVVELRDDGGEVDQEVGALEGRVERSLRGHEHVAAVVVAVSAH